MLGQRVPFQKTLLRRHSGILNECKNMQWCVEQDVNTGHAVPFVAVAQGSCYLDGVHVQVSM